MADDVDSDFCCLTYGLKDDVLKLMIFGGRQGSSKINQTVVDAIPEFNHRQYQVIFATGQKRYDHIKQELADVEIGDNVKVVPYIKDMPDKMPKVAALVSRAGATTIGE